MKRGRKPTPKVNVRKRRGRPPHLRVRDYTFAVALVKRSGDYDKAVRTFAKIFRPPLDPEVLDEAVRGKVSSVNRWRAVLLGPLRKGRQAKIKDAWARGAYKNRRPRELIGPYSKKKGPPET
jgi:hypothetical protein